MYLYTYTYHSLSLPPSRARFLSHEAGPKLAEDEEAVTSGNGQVSNKNKNETCPRLAEDEEAVTSGHGQVTCGGDSDDEKRAV